MARPSTSSTDDERLSENVPTASITVVIAARNEAQHIESCVQSVLANEGLDGPVDVIVVDGNSTDKTVEIVQRLADADRRLRLINNPAGYAPHAFNLGIRKARGRHVMIMSGHAKLDKHHLAACVKALDTGGADIVGGATKTEPGGDTSEAQAVWAVMTHPLGFGPSNFRHGVKSPTRVDTVAFGAMRGDLFAKVGLFDEDLIRGQDDEFNARVRKAGGKILLLPNLECAYSARTTIAQLYRLCLQYGAFKPVSNLKAGNLISIRQFAPSAMLLTFIGGLLAGLIWSWVLLLPAAIALAYLLIALTVAENRMVGFSPLNTWLVFRAFIAAHVGYGVGFLYGTLAVLRYGSDAAKSLAKSNGLVRLSR